MTASVANVAGEVVHVAASDAEAARWFVDNGRRGDCLAETGELLSDVAADVLGVVVTFNDAGCVAIPAGADDEGDLVCECEQDWNCGLHAHRGSTWIDRRYQGLDEVERPAGYLD